MLFRSFAGPHCGQLLADYGADVIKIEPKKGDDSRHWAPFHTGQTGSGSLFLVVNRGKRSLVADLKNPAGLALVRRLALQADVVLQNFSAGVMDRLGLDYASLKKDHPRLIYCTISAFGETGPMAHARGYDPMMQAFSGMMRLPQEGEPPPSRINIPLIDFTTGQNAFTGILAAVLNRHSTGEGAHIEACLADSALSLQAWGLQRLWAAQNTNTAPASVQAVSDNVPYESFMAQDGWIFIACGNNKLWQQFCRALGRPELSDHPAYAANASRRAHYDELMGQLRPLIAAQPRTHWEQAFLSAGVPFARVNTLAELATDPQIEASGMIQQYSSPEFGRVKSVAPALRFNATVSQIQAPAPALGAHTRQILSEFGCTQTEIEQLFASGAVGGQ